MYTRMFFLHSVVFVARFASTSAWNSNVARAISVSRPRATLRLRRVPTLAHTMQTNFQSVGNLSEQFQRLRSLRLADAPRSVLHSGLLSGEPSFTRLFTHKEWEAYNGRKPALRWIRTILTWRFSTVLRTVWPISSAAALWAFGVTSLPASLLPGASQVPMGLIGQALGLLLLFRTTGSYQRLADARELWGRVVILTRQVAQNVVAALMLDKDLPEESAHIAANSICRCLLAFSWELDSKLSRPATDGKVLRVLFPESEAVWISRQRSPPLQLLALMRRVLYEQWTIGNLAPHVHQKLIERVDDLDAVVGACERLFSSPEPPTMSRHAVRCMVLWLFALPFVLAGSSAPILVAIWVFIISYIFVGIEVVGMQVEQPFQIVPMAQLCNVIMTNLEEAFLQPFPGTLGSTKDYEG